MFKRILIANRGEIAVRVIRACQELGVEAVAIYSDADKNALHVQLADLTYRVGPADATESYLNKKAVLEAAIQTKSEAIHPGYGFLSEDADFAEMVTKAGIVWIGPMPETLRLVGDKDAARAAMAPSGIPMSKGSAPLESNEMALKAAAEVGYPVILKPVSGGGGKGMFVAHSEEDLKNILHLVDLKKVVHYFEHYIEHSRHIEAQILADNYGTVLFLGERECSLQRRNQKLLEESPSVALTEEMRREIGRLAIKAAKSVHYSNAGTVEFLLDLADNKFYFMEINPRVQVEHAITEAVTGVDIVRRQIQIADGEPLGLMQKNIKIRGHAIECRINAEDPYNFIPSPGLIESCHLPGGFGIRVDSHIYQGYRIPPNYDSLIGKICVHGKTRELAVAKMRVAMDELAVNGIKTNAPLHRDLFRDEGFIKGGVSIHYLEHWLAERKERLAKEKA